MLKIAHFLFDTKFMPINIFERTKSVNQYFLVKDSKRDIDNEYLHYLKIINRNEMGEICLDSDFDVYIFHSLSYTEYDNVLSIPQNKIVVWFLFGYEIYSGQGLCPPICDITLYKRLTGKFFIDLKVKDKDRYKYTKFRYWLQSKFPVKRWKDRFNSFIEKENVENSRRVENLLLQKKTLNRINYFAPIIYSEYEYMIENKFFKAKYFPFQYSHWSIKSKYNQIDENSNMILLGNSAYPLNNHLDVIKVLSDNKIKNQLYVPMAYGDCQYKRIVKDWLSYYKLNYIIQDDFISFEEYSNILRKCRVAIFGHIRQQASDNIFMCLIQGSKLFFYKDSMMYKFLKENDFIIFTIEDDLNTYEINKCLSDTEKEINLRKTLDYVSVESTLKRTKIVLEQIERSINSIAATEKFNIS